LVALHHHLVQVDCAVHQLDASRCFVAIHASTCQFLVLLERLGDTPNVDQKLLLVHAKHLLDRALSVQLVDDARRLYHRDGFSWLVVSHEIHEEWLLQDARLENSVELLEHPSRSLGHVQNRGDVGWALASLLICNFSRIRMHI
jgi:hypothetical protein